MESDFRVVVMGLPEDLAQKIGSVVGAAVHVFEGSGAGLDFRRMHRIMVAGDYAAALEELSKETRSGDPIHCTNEEYGIGVAKLVTIPGDTDAELVLVFDARIAAGLAAGEQADSAVFHMCLHLVHHELCHVDDANKWIDALGSEGFSLYYEGKDTLIRPLATVCWDEYAANRRCCATASEDTVQAMAANLADSIRRTKDLVDAAILDYRFHSDTGRLVEEFRRHGEYLPKAAAYLLGYADGLGMATDELCPETHETLIGSYFEPIFLRMRDALRRLHDLPSEARNVESLDELAGVTEEYYQLMGLILETTVDKEIYVHVPFRPETTPADS